VIPGTVTSSGVRLSTGSRNTLTEGDAAAIASEVPGVLAAAPGAARHRPGGERQSELVDGNLRRYPRVPDGA
jgi:hypothetical protein